MSGESEPRKRRRTSSRGVTARQEAAGTASRAGGPCGGLCRCAGGAVGGERGASSCSQRHGASRSQGGHPGVEVGRGRQLTP